MNFIFYVLVACKLFFIHTTFSQDHIRQYFLRQIFSLRLKQINRLKSKQFEKSYRIKNFEFELTEYLNFYNLFSGINYVLYYYI